MTEKTASPTSAAPVPSDHIMGVYSARPAGVRARRGRAPLHHRRAMPIWTAWPASRSTRWATPIPSWSQVLKDQAEKLWHVSNIFTIPGQEALGQTLTRRDLRRRGVLHQLGHRGDRVRPQDGAQVPLRQRRSRSAIDIIGFDGSFHGRTLAAVNASGNPSYVEGFGPTLPGFVQAEVGRHGRPEGAGRGPTTAAILLEPVQGEGGARVDAGSRPARRCASCATRTARC